MGKKGKGTGSFGESWQAMWRRAAENVCRLAGRGPVCGREGPDRATTANLCAQASAATSRTPCARVAVAPATTTRSTSAQRAATLRPASGLVSAAAAEAGKKHSMWGLVAAEGWAVSPKQHRRSGGDDGGDGGGTKSSSAAPARQQVQCLRTAPGPRIQRSGGALLPPACWGEDWGAAQRTYVHSGGVPALPCSLQQPSSS